jgi:predicted metallopeptidase
MDLWRAESDVTDLAEAVIKKYRPELADTEIVYIMREKAGKKGNKVVIATARKVATKENVVHSFEGKPDVTFVVEIGADAWKELSPQQREAVMHHELCHCGFDDKEDGGPEPAVIQHDIEEFSAVVDAHGFYMKDIADFATKILNMREEGKTATE